MTAETIHGDAGPQLRPNSLGLPELVFQGVTHIAPAANIVFTFPIIALQAGPVMPLSFLLSTMVCFFIGNTVFQFSRYMPSSGGYYSFATRGLGSRSGFMATWSYLIYEILGAAGATGFLGYLISDMLQKQFHVNIPWWSFALVTTVLVWALTYHGIQLSAQITTLLGGLELLIMLALGITFLIHPGPGSTYLAPLRPSSSPHHFGGILAGMVFSILALSGFEAPAPLAQEARRPGKLVGQSIMLSLGSIGIFYILTSYASAIGWGTGNMAAFASNPNPYYVLGHALWGAGWWFVVLALVNSAVGVGLACTNAASRVMYTMGLAGTLPARFGYVHSVHRTPTMSIAFVQISGFAAILLVGFLLKPDTIFGFLETIATLAVIILYAMANLALTSYMRREQRGKFMFWQHVAAPWFATLALIPVLIVTVYPKPAWPYSLTPYLFLVGLLAGFAYMQWRESRHPGVLHRGAMMLIRTDGALERDVHSQSDAVDI
ncbi:APC family permease [Alloacidobacterium sp.]|uniref:APC family permease n=1 Tax=Alloacidobacterium sp. TaxID=2951999 RepID=UPI002D5DFAB5|nr:APC family permease [Alloacidobacterium sp.]HYK36295.1 APC family permease [Alloacidobacterium sp.]